MQHDIQQDSRISAWQKMKKKRNKSTFNDEKKNVKFQPKNFAKFLSGVDMSRGFFKMQIEL